MKKERNSDGSKVTNPVIPQAATILNASNKTKSKVQKGAAESNEGLNDSTQCSI